MDCITRNKADTGIYSLEKKKLYDLIYITHLQVSENQKNKIKISKRHTGSEKNTHQNHITERSPESRMPPGCLWTNKICGCLTLAHITNFKLGQQSPLLVKRSLFFNCAQVERLGWMHPQNCGVGVWEGKCSYWFAVQERRWLIFMAPVTCCCCKEVKRRLEADPEAECCFVSPAAKGEGGATTFSLFVFICLYSSQISCGKTDQTLMKCSKINLWINTYSYNWQVIQAGQTQHC